MSEQTRLIEEIFHRIVDLPPAEREPAALSLARLDAALASRALALVEAHERATRANRLILERAQNSEQARRFGPYQILRLLGTGGMGAVYLAERADGAYQSQVAVKVIGQHFAGPGFEDRFRAERQILAQLSHPNIARLLDGGVSDRGEPYLVLEYVEGDHLDGYCEHRGLDRPARLRLFLKVCAAVEFAHRNMVVHRDLKPSNIIVSNDGEPKLLDFGAARLLTSVASNVSVPLVTPRYASPEQLQAQPATAASDVYSLGVVLYELIAGTALFPAGSSWESVLARITGDEPPKPTPELRGDLWTIVEKALAREPERRYPSVRELAEDLERYLEQRPIHARPRTLAYRGAKFARRNRLATVAAVLLFVAIAAGVGSTLWEARRAEQRFLQLRQLARFVLSDMNTGLQQIPGSTDLQRLSVERSLAYLDGLAREAGNDQSLRIEVADGYRRLGDVLGNPFRPNLGERPRAQAAYEKGLAALAGLPSSGAAGRLAAELHLQIGGVRAFGGNAAAGLDEIRRAVAELRRLSAAAPRDVELRLAVARGVDFLGTRLAAGGGEVEARDRKEAEALFNEAAAQAQAVLDMEPANPLALQQLALTENNHGLIIGSSEPTKALEHYRRAVAWIRRMPPAQAARLDARRLSATIFMNTGFAEGQAGQYEQAIADQAAAGAILSAWLAVDPNNTYPIYQLTSVYRTSGIVEGYRKNAAAAVDDFRKAAELHRELIRRDPSNTTYRYQRAEALIRGGNWLVALHRQAEARAQSAEGLQVVEDLAARPKARLSHVFAGCRWLTETEVVELRKPARAAEFCRKAMELTHGEDPDAFSGLANALVLMGDRPGAAQALEKALTLIPPAVPGQTPSQQRKELEAALRRLRR